MSAGVPAALAAAAVAVALGAPSPAALRLPAVRRPDRPPAARPVRALTGWSRTARTALPLVAAALLLAGPAVAGLGLVAAVLVPRVVAGRRRSRERQAERAGVLDACGALAAELRAGRTPAEALTVAAALVPGGTGAGLRSGAAAASWGGDVAAALRAGATGSAAPEVLAALAACWQVCARAGGGLAAAVETVGEGVRARSVQERAVAAALAGPRASAGLLALLPLAGIALAAGLGARPGHVLLHTPLGLGCLVAGVALDLLGLLWTRALVTRAAGTG